MKKVGDYTLYKLLGKGSFGEVYLTQKENNPEILATKILDKKQTDRPSVKKYFDNEISIMKELKHPNIVRFYDLLASYSHYYVVMEYCNGGALSNCLQKYKALYHKPFTQEIIQYLMRQIVEGLQYIHSHKIIHRDIKLDNILVTFYNENDKNSLNMLASQIKIIDFGLATKLGPQDLTFTALGSPINMDPLILKKFNKAGGYQKLMGYNEKADIWSLGTICYEMLTGEPMFKVKDLNDLIKKVESGNYSIPININFTKESVSFLNAMLQYEGKDRLSTEELSQHDFLLKNVKDFSKVDLRAVSDKIDRNGLNINIKENQTIWNLFNENEPKEVNPFINQNVQNQHQNERRRAQSRGNYEQKFIFSNNIYEFYDNNNNDNNKNETVENFFDHRRATDGNARPNFIPIPHKKNRPLENNNRFTEGFVSPQKNVERKEYEPKKDNKKIYNIEANINKKDYDKKDSSKKENEKNEKEREEAKKYIKGLLEEYRSAKEYFKVNDLKIQEEEANKKYLEILNLKKIFEEGYVIKINLLPDPITPEFIYGCSKEERDSVFKEIISKYTDEKSELEEKIRTTILKIKQLPPEKYAKVKGTMMPKLESVKTKLEKLKKIIEGFENKYKNKWIPAPKISKDSEKSESKDYKLKIHIGKTDYKKDNLLLTPLLTINENKTLSKEVKLKKIGDFDEEIIWTLNSEEWNNFENYIFMLEYCYTTNLDERFWVKLNISQIKDLKELLFQCPIDLYAENITIKISIKITLEINERNISLESAKKETFIIKKLYPEFKGKSAGTEIIPNLLLNK